MSFTVVVAVALIVTARATCANNRSISSDSVGALTAPLRARAAALRLHYGPVGGGSRE